LNDSRVSLLGESGQLELGSNWGPERRRARLPVPNAPSASVQVQKSANSSTGNADSLQNVSEIEAILLQQERIEARSLRAQTSP
jgi:hypothetical protein